MREFTHLAPIVKICQYFEETLKINLPFLRSYIRAAPIPPDTDTDIDTHALFSHVSSGEIKIPPNTTGAS